MKRIIYRITYDTPNGVETHTLTVTAKNTDSGFAKALRSALHGNPTGWRLHTVELIGVES